MNASSRHAQHRVMIVEDHADTREALAIVMETRGVDAVLAASGEEALAKLAGPADRPCVVLLDVNMPDLDGWQVRQRMREDPDLAAVPVVLLTGNYIDVERARRLGIHGYLRKPVDVHQIIAAIEEHCVRRDAPVVPRPARGRS